VTDELTAEQEAAVRRLLAQARHEGPVPPEVAARLDEVLDGLVADEGVDDLEVFESGDTGSVSDLAAVRHRRRNAGRLLLAAAAVVIGGVAVGQAVGGSGLDAGSDDSDAAGSTLAEAPRDGATRSQEGADSEDTGGAAAPVQPGPESAGEIDLLAQVEAPLALTSDNFAADVQRELGRTAAERRIAANADYDGVLAYSSVNGDFVCADGVYGEGATLPAYYDAEEAVLVLRRPRAGIQRVDLLTCGTAVELNSVNLPAP
jgi:hypothetical protein